MTLDEQLGSFRIWLDTYASKRAGGPDVPARIVVLMAILERLRDLPELSRDRHLTPNHQQLIDHDRYVASALERFQIESPLTAGGRRASNVAAWIGPLFDWLSEQNFTSLTNEARIGLLHALGKFAGSRVQRINEAEPLIVRYIKGTAKAVVGDLLDQAQAKNRAKDVAEYLVGAKLQVLYGESVIEPKNVNTPTEYADFQLGNAAIEVTVSAVDRRHMDQINHVLNDTSLDFWLIVRLKDRGGWESALAPALDDRFGRRVVVADIETYLCTNVSERGRFEQEATESNLGRIFEVYNRLWIPKAGGSGLRIVSGDPS